MKQARGRPTKNGLQPAWMLFRSFLVLSAYNEARRSPLKHSSAVTEAVAIVKKTWPGMPISETEVKRILAKFQPKGIAAAVKVEKVSDSPLRPAVCLAMGVPEGSKMKTTFVFGFGPRPEYPRI
jgi:hypothetical protein